MLSLPKEIVREIAFRLSPTDYYNILQTSKKMNVLSEYEIKYKKYSSKNLEELMLKDDLKGVKFRIEFLGDNFKIKESFRPHKNINFFNKSLLPKLIYEGCFDVIPYYMKFINDTCLCNMKKISYKTFMFLIKEDSKNIPSKKTIKLIRKLLKFDPFSYRKQVTDREQSHYTIWQLKELRKRFIEYMINTALEKHTRKVVRFLYKIRIPRFRSLW